MILNKSKVEEAANDYAVATLGVPEISCEQGAFDEAENDFKAGVEWIESQIKDMSIEFLSWIDCQDRHLASSEEWFDKFIKERNG